MLGTINKILKKILGDKSEKDVQEISPIVDKINIIYNELKGLSNDQLRSKTAGLKAIIRERISGLEGEIRTLKSKIEADPNMDIE